MQLTKEQSLALAKAKAKALTSVPQPQPEDVEEKKPSLIMDFLLKTLQPESLANIGSAVLGSQVPKRSALTAKDVLGEGRTEALGSGIMEGATLGFRGELGSGIEAGLEAVQGENFMTAYKRALAQAEAEERRKKEAFPGSYLAGEIGGSLPLGIITGTALSQAQKAKDVGRFGRMLSQGALAGTEAGIAGFGTETGTIPERAKTASISAAIGAPLGIASELPLPFGKTPEAKKLEQSGVDLSLGQAMGGGTKYAEDIFTRGLLGDIIGATAEQKKGFETFTKSIIEQSLSDIGFVAPKGLNSTQIANEALEQIDDYFKEAVESASLPDATPAINFVEELVSPESISELKLSPEQTKDLMKSLNNLFVKQLDGTSMLGQNAQNAMSDLGKKAFSLMGGDSTSADRNVAKKLNELKDLIMDSMIEQDPANQSLKKARNAYKNKGLIEDILSKSEKKEAITPASVQTSLRRKLGRKEYTKSPMYETSRLAKEVLGTGAIPSREPNPLAANIGSFLLPSAIAGGYLNPLALSVIPSLAAYRGGRPGRDLAMGLLSTPAATLKSTAAAPTLVPSLMNMYENEQVAP